MADSSSSSAGAARGHYDSVLRPGLFAGQVHWVTGAGSGIGRCVAHELASLGATVILSGRTQEKLDRVAAEIAEDGGHRITSFAVDPSGQGVPPLRSPQPRAASTSA